MSTSVGMYFNSHPHEEDDKVYSGQKFLRQISTHILTKRMTVQAADSISCVNISTHILTKRMTFLRHQDPLQKYHFNSHPHEEDDGISQWKFNGINISTHILTKRMTAILNKNNLFKIAYYINNKHFISIVDIFFHFHIYF